MSDRTAEALPYAAAVLILVLGGALWRTAILNWFVGPMIVVVTVSVLHPLLARRNKS